MKRRALILLLLAVIVGSVLQAEGRRRMTPVNTAATATQAINETANDTARINARRRANSISYVDDRGTTVFVDTITGDEWIDSTLIARVPKMEYPLWDAVSAGINVWDPLMRVFGQHYGIADAWVELSLHNRYKPIIEVGLGTADNTPAASNFTYRSPMSVYFRIGANYNFLFNSDPAYQFFAGVRYGFSPFRFSVDNVTVDAPYWQETSHFNIPAQNITAGWFEFLIGLRVKLWGPFSAGWTVKYQTILHQSKARYGDPWYIPGFGTRNGNVTGSFSFVYTFSISHLNKPKAPAVVESVKGHGEPPAAPAEPEAQTQE